MQLMHRQSGAWISVSVLIMAVILGLWGCTRPGSQQGQGSADGAQTGTQTKFRVGLVLDKGGRDDKSFNSAAFLGATAATTEIKAELRDVQAPDDSAFEPAIRAFAEKGFPLVISVGFIQADAVKKVAALFPQTKFAIVDGLVEAPNVASLMFAEHEGSYLVGYAAGLATKTNQVGFIGGMEIPLIRRFQRGYEAGVQAANPKAKIIVNYIGVNSAAWANPTRGKELALAQYGQGADVIFHAAGASGMGVFDAAEEKKTLAIGVDSNQNHIRPGRVLTSMLKRVDQAVSDVIREASAGQFKAGTRYFGIKDKGVDYAVDEHNEALIAPHRAKLEEVRRKIIAGEIKVPDYYEEAKAGDRGKN